jgi:hypothetical protein
MLEESNSLDEIKQLVLPKKIRMKIKRMLL